MRRFLIIASIVCVTLSGFVSNITGDDSGPVLIKEVMSREMSVQVEPGGTEGVKEVFSREISLFVENGGLDLYRQAISREASIVVTTDTPPASVTELQISLSPTGDRATLDWSGYNQWAENDIDHFEIYYTSDGPFDTVPADGLSMIEVPANTTSTVIEGLPEFTDHYFAVVAVDALDNYEPAVTYSAGYVLSSETFSRELSLFVENGPLDPTFSQSISREIDIVVTSDAPPASIVDLVVNASPTGETVTLDWSAYNQWAEKDVARFDIYFSDAGPINTVPDDGTLYLSVPANSTSAVIDGLAPFADHFFAVVPVDALGQFEPAVYYSAAYTLAPQVISREYSIFSSGKTTEPSYSQVISRETSILIPDSNVPDPVTGIDSGFYVETSVTEFGAVDMDWTSYNEPAQQDVVSYNIYVNPEYFEEVQGPDSSPPDGLLPFASVPAGIQSYTLSGLPGGEILYFAVVAVDALGNFDPAVRGFSAKVSVSGVGEVVNLDVEGGAESLTFTWEIPPEAEAFLSHYHVYFAGATTPETLSADQTSWTATELAAATGYPFRIATVDVFGDESDGTSVIGATWLPNPTNVALTAEGSDVILLWDAVEPSELVQYYAIYKDTAPIADVSGLAAIATRTGTSMVLGTFSDVADQYFAVATVNISNGMDPNVVSVFGTKQSQTMEFTAISEGPLTIPLEASASSGLPVRFISSEPSVASIEDGNLMVHQGGAVTVTARQDGNASYWPVQETQSLRFAPIIQSVTANGVELENNFVFASPEVAVQVYALDNDGIAIAEFHGRIPGQTWKLLSTDASEENGLIGKIDVIALTDGGYELRVVVKTAGGYSAERTYQGTIALAPPPPPVLDVSLDGLVVSGATLTLTGAATPDTRITVYNNGVVVAQNVLVNSSGRFTVVIPLNSGDNIIQVSATNRSGESVLTDAVTVTHDPTALSAPIGFEAASRPAGLIRLSWMRPQGGTPAGYHIYRSAQPFDSPSQALRVTGQQATGLFYEDLPIDEGDYYYAATSVDSVGNESEMTAVRSARSDATPPQALSIEYATDGAYDPATGRFGVGTVEVALTVSEALAATPFFSMNVAGKDPLPVTLRKNGEEAYEGSFAIEPGWAADTAYAVFSCKDKAGNSGTAIVEGQSIEVDAVGPAVTQLDTAPASPVHNDPGSPATITVTFSLDEAVPSGTTPELSYLLSGEGRDPAAIDNLVAVETAPGHAQTWQGDFTLPADAGSIDVETFSFIYQGTDDLGNTGETILVANRFQVYQGELPPLETPTGLVAQSLPGGQIQLQWDQVAQAAGYQVYRQAPGEDSLQPLFEVPTAQYLDSPAVEGLYVYAVASVRRFDTEEAVSAMSENVEAESDATAPGIPQNLALELTSTGIHAVWDEVDDQDPVSYRLYRSDQPEIADVSGLTPVTTVVDADQAVDAHPSSTHHTYAVTAADPAGNASAPSESVYINFELLPVDNLAVVQADDQKPVITWSADGDSIVGFDIYLGPDTSGVRLNDEPLVQPTYTDVGYSGDTRTYTVVALDDGGHESLGRTITLPRIDMALAEGEAVHRNLMNLLTCQVENLTDALLSNMTLIFDVANHTGHASETFDLEPNATSSVSATVGGYDDLPAEADLAVHLMIEPNPGESVAITRTGNIEVIEDTLVATILSDNWIRGGTANVQFTLENTGEDTVEIVTARDMGAEPSDEVQALLTDTDGNVLSEASLRQSQGEYVVTLGDGVSIARIPAGDVFTSATIALPVPHNAPDEVRVNIPIDQVHHGLGQAEVVTLPGPTASQQVSLVDTSYTGMVTSATPETSNGGEDIAITGQAIERGSQATVPLAPLKLVVSNKGYEHTFTVYTAEDGVFTHTYVPTANDSGTFLVWAVHPDITHKPVQAEFVINKLILEETTWELSIPRNYEYRLVCPIKAGEGVSMHNLQLEILGADQPGGSLPAGLHLAPDAPVAMLASNENADLGVLFWGDNTAPQTGRIVINVKSDENPSWGKLSVDYYLSSAEPALFYTPSYVETGVAREDTVTETVTLENKGLADMTGVTVRLLDADGNPAPDWAVLNSETEQGDLEVGDTLNIDIIFAPRADTSEAIHHLVLRVQSDNAPDTDINLYAAVTQSGIGNVFVKVEDLYTGWENPETQVTQQGVAGASVKLQNENVLTEEYESTTDESDEALFNDLPAGWYKLLVRAADHQQYLGRVKVLPGVTRNKDVFLQCDLVTVDWEVVETTVEDKYDIVLSATYETEVPAPVVVAEPAYLNLPEMQAGEVIHGEIRFINYGLITAQNLDLGLPEDDEYFKYEYMVSSLPESLEAKQVFTVPYRVTCKKPLEYGEDGSGAGQGYCFYSGIVTLYFCWPCINEVWACGSASFSYFFGWPCPGEGGGGGVLWPGGGGGPGGFIDPKGMPLEICPPWLMCLFAENPCECLCQSQQASSQVHLLTGTYMDDETDMSVKTPGGMYEVKRLYYENRWHFRDVNDQLGFIYELGKDGELSAINMDGLLFKKEDEAGTVFVSLGKYRIRVVDDGYRWEDNYGNWLAYDADGKITGRGNRNGLVASYGYHNNRLSAIFDSTGRQIVSLEYDGANLSAVQDYAGRRVSYHYTEGLLVRVADMLDHETLYFYDSFGRLVRKQLPEGRTVDIAYNDYNYVTSILDDHQEGQYFEYFSDSTQSEFYAKVTTTLGKETEYWYDADGDLIRQDVNGTTVQRIAFTGRTKSVFDADGRETVYKYDSRDNIIETIYPDGTSVSSDYDPVYNSLLGTTKELGIETRYEYDDRGNRIRKTEAAGTADERIAEYEYDEAGRMIKEKRIGHIGEDDAVTTMTYDEFGNMETLADPENGITRFLEYDSMGNVLRKKDPRGKIWLYAYDAMGRLETITDPLEYETRYFYDAAGNKIRQIDAENRETVFDYDTAGNLIRIIDAESGATLKTYDGEGRCLTTTDPEGKLVSSNEYNLFGDLIRTIDGNGNAIEHVYSYGGGSGCATCGGASFGKISKNIYPTFEREYQYDPRGRRISVTDKLGEDENQITVFEYDAAGNRIAVIDPAGNRTSYEYDALNRKIATIDATGGRTEFAYDSRNNLVALKDANGNVTVFEYDLNDRLVKEIRPMGEETAYAYDEAGNFIEKIDSKNQRSEYIHDDGGRLVETRYYENSTDPSPVKSVAFTYDKVGNLLSYDDGTTSASYAYDKTNRKLSETVDYGDFSLGHSYTYYENGLKRTFTGPDGNSYAYAYDANNTLGSISVPGVGDMIFENDTWNQPTRKVLPGGTSQAFEYDPLMRVKSLSGSSSSQGEIINYEYNYNSAGTIDQKITEHGAYDYDYDQMHQLTSSDNPDFGDETYSYDHVGNRLHSADTVESWAYNANSELDGFDGTSFEYDDNGNLTGKIVDTAATTYLHNVENRLKRIEDSVQGVIAEYYYDPFGRRLMKNANGETTWFHYTEEGPVIECDANGNILKKYAFKPGSTWCADPLFVMADRNDDGELEVYFYMNDQLGTPQKAIDTSGNVVWEQKYTAFGSTVSSQGESVFEKFGFPGQYFDDESGLFYNMHRYFDPKTGRYIATDPIGYGNRPVEYGVQGYGKNDLRQNPFHYANNNPLTYIDPFGTIPVSGSIGGNACAFLGGSGQISIVPCCENCKLVYKVILTICFEACTTPGGGVSAGGSVGPLGDCPKQTIPPPEICFGCSASVPVSGVVGAGVGCQTCIDTSTGSASTSCSGNVAIGLGGSESSATAGCTIGICIKIVLY